MERDQNPEVTPLTKYLVGRIHAGRKVDSKFWQSEFDIPNSDIPPKSKKSDTIFVHYIFKAAFLLVFILLSVTTIVFLYNAYTQKYDLSSKKRFITLEPSQNLPTETKYKPKPTFRPNKAPSSTSNKDTYLNYDYLNPKNYSASNNQTLRNKDIPRISLNGFVFTWKDENGNWHSSNTDFPANNPTLRVQTEIDTYKRVTPFLLQGNQILVPVTLENKGYTTRFNILLDTGCSNTVVPSKYLNRSWISTISATD